MSKGLLMVYTGNGEARKGMALGQVFRSLSRGFRVCFVSFSARSSDCLTLEWVLPQEGVLEFHGVQGQDNNAAGRPSNDLATVEQAWEFAKDAIGSQRFELVVLDGIIRPINQRVLSEIEVVEFLRGKSASPNIILTGQDAPSSLIELADLVSEAKETKGLT